MQRHFYLDGAYLYRETVPVAAGANPFAYLWPFEEAAKATQCLLALPDGGARFGSDVEDRQHGRLAYWQPRRGEGLTRRPSYASYPPHPLGQGGDSYFDDNTWVALDVIQLYRLSALYRAREHVGLLDRARVVFELVSAGWADERQPYPGGVYWVDAGWNRDRGAAVTAGFTTLALRLHEVTAPETDWYIQTARRAYAWLRQTLWIADGPTAGLYHDKVLGDGQLDASQWIYNQGVPIAAGVMLHRVTGQPEYLEQARVTADATLAWYGAQGYAGQPAIFVAIFFRNLLQLAAVTDEPTYRAAMQAYADRAWDAPRIHDPATDLFRFDGPTGACTLLDQAAMVQLYALLAWPPERYGMLA